MANEINYDGGREAAVSPCIESITDSEYSNSLNRLFEYDQDFTSLKSEILTEMETQIGTCCGSVDRKMRLSDARKLRRIDIFRRFPSLTATWSSHLNQLIAAGATMHRRARSLQEILAGKQDPATSREMASLKEVVSTNSAIMSSIACVSRPLIFAIEKESPKVKRKLADSLYNYYVKAAYKVTPNNGLSIFNQPDESIDRRIKSVANVDIALSYVSSRTRAIQAVLTDDQQGDDKVPSEIDDPPSIRYKGEQFWLAREVIFKDGRPYINEYVTSESHLLHNMSEGTREAAASDLSSDADTKLSPKLYIGRLNALLTNLGKPRALPSEIDRNEFCSFSKHGDLIAESIENGMSPSFDITSEHYTTIVELADSVQSSGEYWASGNELANRKLTNLLRYDTVCEGGTDDVSQIATNIIESNIEHLQKSIIRSREHDAIYACFLARYNDGRRHRLLDAILSVYLDRESSQRIETARRSDMSRMAGNDSIDELSIDRFPIGHTIRPSATYAVEVFEDDQSDRGYAAVLNQAFNGSGALLARYAHLSQRLRTNISNHVRRLALEAEPNVVVPNRDCDNSLARLDIDVPIHEWVTSAAADISDGLGSLTFKIDSDGRFELFRDSQPIVLVPFSLRPIWTFSGPFRILWRFFDPWIDRSTPSLDSADRFYGRVPEAGLRERKALGSLVVQRKTYSVGVSQLTPYFNSTLKCQLMLMRLLSEVGMGDRCFYIYYPPGSDSGASKPIPLFSDSAFSVDKFIRDIKTGGTVSFVEMLPYLSEANRFSKTEHYVSAIWDKAMYQGANANDR